MGLNPDENPFRSTEDLSRILSDLVEYAAARKHRVEILRKVEKTLSSVSQGAPSAKTSRGTSPLLDPELHLSRQCRCTDHELFVGPECRPK